MASNTPVFRTEMSVGAAMVSRPDRHRIPVVTSKEVSDRVPWKIHQRIKTRVIRRVMEIKR